MLKQLPVTNVKYKIENISTDVFGTVEWSLLERAKRRDSIKAAKGRGSSL